MESSKSYPIHS